MNPAAPGKTATRSSGYHQKALAEIRNSLLPFANIGSSDPPGSSAASTVSSGVSSGFSSSSGNGLDKDLNVLPQSLNHLITLGYDEDLSVRALKYSGGRLDAALDYLSKQQEPLNGVLKSSNLSALGTKLIRKPSLERELSLHRGSPALDSGAGSSRSDSPRGPDAPHDKLSRQYSPSGFEPPPPPPPRCPSTPPAPPAPPVPPSVQQLMKRMSPAPPLPPARGTSPVAAPAPAPPARQPMIVQNGPQVQQQLTQQIQALNIYQAGAGAGGAELPPPYPLAGVAGVPPPPSYSVSMQNRQSPTQAQDYRKSPSSGVYSGASAGSPSPVTVSSGAAGAGAAGGMTRPTPIQAWTARQAVQPPIIMQSVKSTQVQKPVLQTAIAPVAPAAPAQPPPPSYASSIQQKQAAAPPPPSYPLAPKPASPAPAPPAAPAPAQAVPTTEPPSYAITMQALAAQRGLHPPHAPHAAHPVPPPPYGPQPPQDTTATGTSHHSPLHKKFSNNCDPKGETSQGLDVKCSNQNCTNNVMKDVAASTSDKMNGSTERRHKPLEKIRHQSPIPERRNISKEKEDERRDCKVRNYSPQAFKFFMEQHVENILKSYKQRTFRRMQLEKEMTKIGLSAEAQCQMRKMLSQKESNYIRLKRAKMDKSMFTKIKPIGVGAFGEVTLVRKIDTSHLYAMKTLRKADVLKRNQVAHVKAERDILAEADNEWVVKLYYSFQDKDNLYFVMDYIPGGDLMSLLIKQGIFEEKLARFYIAELTCAVESVHRMGFIHRDIKPDNILIDRDGHIKLTDFGLCTGFRWTHNSKYYQRNDHGRQDSMDPVDGEWGAMGECRCHQLKPLERRRKREHQRCLAHSLVGTPNYIAPEVLQRTGYTQLCDWWSVGVILYEMLVGSPPFLAATPAETQLKVINWESTLHIPDAANLTRDAKDLILQLCSGQDTRLGKDATEVKNHPFLKTIDFDKGIRRQVAPYIPRIEYPTDTSNFDPIDPDKLRNSGSSDSNKSDSELLDNGKTFHGFFEFTFRRFFDDGYTNKINLDDNDNQGPVYV